MTDPYQQLARHLDRLPAGYPATQSGVEIRILKRLFTPQEALIAAGLTMMPESIEAISARLAIDCGHVAPILQQMSAKGLIFRRMRGDTPQYMAAQFVIGIWEYHVNALDEDLIRDFNAYISYLGARWAQQKTKQLRVIPLSKSINAEMTIMPYEQAEHIIRQQSKITVAPCICRREHQMVGKGCHYPLEACLCFGAGAHYYEQNGLGRAIDVAEALDILRRGAEAGLVLQPGNAQKAMNICMCCGCCCQVLKQLKALPMPAKAVNSSYFAVVDPSACIGCGTCAERCHMDAIVVDQTAQINTHRCIGCGVCVSSCEPVAIKLMAKTEQERWIPPTTVPDTYANIARERGLLP
jgi:electron transport complex protein RnfB